MEAGLLAIAGALEAAGVTQWSHASPWVYPVANIVHLLGLVMLVGGIGIVDLRLTGLWRSIPAAALARALTPVAIAGLMLQVASGTILFAADGAALARSDTFQLKLIVIALALVNALLFRWLWRGSDPAPPLARALAGLSLLLWLWAGALGRLIAYS